MLGCVGCASSGTCGMSGLGERCPGPAVLPNVVNYGDIIGGGTPVQYYGDSYITTPGGDPNVQYDDNGNAFTTIGGTFEETMAAPVAGIPLWVWIVGGFLILYSGQSRRNREKS